MKVHAGRFLRAPKEFIDLGARRRRWHRRWRRRPRIRGRGWARASDCDFRRHSDPRRVLKTLAERAPAARRKYKKCTHAALCHFRGNCFFWSRDVVGVQGDPWEGSRKLTRSPSLNEIGRNTPSMPLIETDKNECGSAPNIIIGKPSFFLGCKLLTLDHTWNNYLPRILLISSVAVFHHQRENNLFYHCVSEHFEISSLVVNINLICLIQNAYVY
jgi:hypothetical protein